MEHKEPATRDCKLCLLLKPVSEFPPCRYRADGLHSYCRECKNQQNREYRDRKKQVDYKGRRIYTKNLICIIADCDRPAKMVSKQYCPMHWTRYKRYGSFDAVVRPFRLKDGEGFICSQSGYRKIKMPDHPNSNAKGYIDEHRYVMAQALNRPLSPDEVVHHRNGQRADNRLENLELWSVSHPCGQRVEDKIKWAIEFLGKYGYAVVPE